jgi:integrase
MAKIDLLSAAKVKSLKTPGDYLDGRGLVLQIRNASSKSWLLKYSIDKRAREMGLGSAFDFTLAETREKRDALRKLIKQGIDPIEQRKADKLARKLELAKSITFRDAAARLIASKRKGWKNVRHAAQWTSTFETFVFPLIGDLPIQAIDTALIVKILTPIWSTRPVTAGRVRGRIESVLNACRALGEYRGENPATWKGHLDHLLPKTSSFYTVKNQPALAYAELPAFMQDLRARDGIAAAALEFQILTASRPGNALGARWADIDRDAAAWTIAAENMKGKRAHKVPLPAAALALLDRMDAIRNGPFIFYSPGSKRPLSDAATGALIGRMGRADVVPHGFRSSFRTWAGDKTNFQREVIEKALAHLVGDETERAYDRGDLFEKRRKLMDAWATFATSDPAQSADVLPFSTRAES